MGLIPIHLLTPARRVKAVKVSSGNVQANDAQGHTFTGLNFGDEAPDRRLVCVACGAGDDIFNAGSPMTIGGVEVTQLVTAIHNKDPETWLVQMQILEVALATGTSGDVYLDFSRTMFNMSCDLWALYGTSGSATDTLPDVENADPLTGTIAVEAGGVVIAGAVARDNLTGWDWTAGPDEDQDKLLEGADYYSTAYKVFENADAALTITADPNANPTADCMCAVAFGPQ